MTNSTQDGPEAQLEILIRSGYPWNMLGESLKKIDTQFKMVSAEYATIEAAVKTQGVSLAQVQEQVEKIDARVERLEGNMEKLEENMEKLEVNVGKIEANVSQLSQDIKHMRLDTVVGVALFLIAAIGFGLTLSKNQFVLGMIDNFASFVGLGLIVIAVVVGYWLYKPRGEKTK